MVTEKIIDNLKEYFNWEKEFDFSGWEEIQIFFGENLVDAWIKARPEDAYKFKDDEFKEMVSNATGKWLEKRFENDSYKIIVSKSGLAEDELCQVILHEMRHCLDYQAAIRDLCFDEYSPGNQFFKNWSEFRATAVSVRYEVFRNIQKNPNEPLFSILSRILGYWSADCVEGLLRAKLKRNKRDSLYFISRYVGASRAVRNLNKELKVKASAFHLWTMTPTFITENFGSVFYLGNEWDDSKEMQLDAIPKTYYYNALIEKIDLLFKN